MVDLQIPADDIVGTAIGEMSNFVCLWRFGSASAAQADMFLPLLTDPPHVRGVACYAFLSCSSLNPVVCASYEADPAGEHSLAVDLSGFVRFSL